MRYLAVFCLLAGLCGCASNLRFESGMRAADSEDYRAAQRIWEDLADNGHAEAQFRLAELYHQGLGTPADIEQAIHWYTRAAQQEHVDAQNSLGIIFADGDGVETDVATALKWYRLAARQGDPGAQFNLGTLYRYEASIRDDRRAYMWWGIAAYLGNDLAGSMLEPLQEGMSATDVAAAEALASACLRSRYRDC